VRLVRQIVALVLLALWLPATQHCAFGTVTGLGGNLCETACSHDIASSHEDFCAVVESGNYMSAATLAHVPAPHLTTLACLASLHACMLAEARPLAPPAWTKDDASGWVPEWAFVARAALPARAPTQI
jgi:hypothetical protein